ncbi:AsmA family protein [Temperatibacter marinus]|uniref:AsmA family protein n=1 Tax=Temperatibacter marinus TaxID=1456591 RepID=A0AA52HAE6_9PROT|nr:AsmA family protein [Temperatibacter marinus]WND02660.1 AsmA family protein [Temperatibacter marinus]
MKKILIFIGLLIVVLFVGVAVFAFKGEEMIASGVSSEGTEILGTKVALRDVKLSPFVGKVQLGGFSIDQPQGYGDGQLVKFDDFTLAVKPASLISQHVEIDVIDLNGLNLNAVMKDRKTNLQALQEKLSTSEENSESVDLKLSAKSILLRNIKASFQYEDGKKHELKLADIELKNVGVDQNGIPPKEMIRHALDALEPQIAKAAVKLGLKSKVKSLEDKLPDDVKGLKDKAKNVLGLFKKKKKDN